LWPRLQLLAVAAFVASQYPVRLSEPLAMISVREQTQNFGSEMIQ